MSRSRILVLLAVVVLVGAFFALGLQRFVTLDALKAQQASVTAYRDAHPLVAALAYFLIYVAVTGLSLPGAAIMTLAGGALFGLVWGTVLVSFASSVGATAAFLLSRFVFRDEVAARFGKRLEGIDQGVARDGAFYLIALRLVPVFPFFLVNLAMALTAIPTRTFYWASQVGMLAATLVYVNAGTQLASIAAPGDIVSSRLLISLALLGVFPLLARLVVTRLRVRRALRRWPKPRRFERNLVVIGAGAAGLVSAYIGATVKAKVTLVEADAMGGDCLNTGCVPSKTLIRSARFVSDARHARTLGVRTAAVDFDFADIMARVRKTIAAIEPHDSRERYESLGVEVVEGHAKIVSPWAVEIAAPAGARTITTRAIVIAAGAKPIVPPIPGLADAGYLTSENVWTLNELPKRLVVLGGGPIGCELAQAFARLGSEVTQVEMQPRVLEREDPDAAALVAAALAGDGVRLLTGHKAIRVEQEEKRRRLVVAQRGAEKTIEFDAILCAVGRTPRVTGYGLEEMGIPLREDRTIETNMYLQTILPTIYACGDVAGPYQFTHTGAHQAWYAALNALLGGLWRFKADYAVIPWATFTDPEVAHVGLNETEAKEKNVAYELTRYELDDLDRAITDGVARGFVKVLTVPGKDRILGVTIVGEHAADLLAEYVLAMKHGVGLKGIFDAIHTYPTLAEANKYAAGAWRRARAPQSALAWAERYFAWRRGKGI